MRYTEEMMLQSKSGYCMPFEERGKDVELALGYGNQKHPVTGEPFFHHGLDFEANHYLLSALASGTVAGIGNDAMHGIYQVIRYGKYEVTYAHLANVFVNFGQMVKAGHIVALSGDRLHFEVKFDGKEINPIDFLTMLYGNVKAMEQTGKTGFPEFETYDMNIATQYDKDQKEIEELMLRFMPSYMEDLYKGMYVTPQHAEQSLRNIFTLSAAKHYFYEAMPSISNPLGIGQRAMPLACKVQNLLIADFLNYLALRHGIYLSTLSEVLKKKLHNEAIRTSGIIDPLADLDIDVQSFDIPRLVSVYPDRAGVRWWTKAWFNNREEGECSVEIELQQAILFIHDRIEKDAWLEEYFPKQMEVYHQAIEQTREQILGQLNVTL